MEQETKDLLAQARWTSNGMLVTYGGAFGPPLSGLRNGATNTGDALRAHLIVAAHNDVVDALIQRIRSAEKARDAAEGKARGWDDISQRSDDAIAFAAALPPRGNLGRNIWHVILDEAIRLRQVLSGLTSGEE